MNLQQQLAQAVMWGATSCGSWVDRVQSWAAKVVRCQLAKSLSSSELAAAGLKKRAGLHAGGLNGTEGVGQLGSSYQGRVALPPAESQMQSYGPNTWVPATSNAEKETREGGKSEPTKKTEGSRRGAEESNRESRHGQIAYMRGLCGSGLTGAPKKGEKG